MCGVVVQWARFSRPAARGHIHQDQYFVLSEPSAIHHREVWKGADTAYLRLFLVFYPHSRVSHVPNRMFVAVPVVCV